MNTQSPPATLSEERLRELRLLYGNATQGPRTIKQDFANRWRVLETRQDLCVPRSLALFCTTLMEVGVGSDEETKANAEFAVAIHNAFPSLLHAAEQMSSAEAKVAKLRMTLAFVLASAQPNGRDNPAMYCAWQEGMKTLAETLPPAPEKGGAA